MKNKIAIITSIVTILVTIVLAALLYATRRQNISPISPDSSSASTTTTISDDFNASSINFGKWDLMYPPSSTLNVVQAGGNLTIVSILPASGVSGLITKDSFVGDFTSSVKISNFLPGSGNYGVASLGRASNFALTWVKKQTESYVEMYGQTPATSLGKVSVGNATSISVKLVKTVDTVQGFVDLGNGFVLVGSMNTTSTADGKFQIYVEEKSGVAGAQSQASFDDFSAQVNPFVPLPTPTPATQCILTFTVQTVVPTNTPTPTPTITPTPTPTPTGVPGVTPTPTPTITPTPTSPPPNSCGGTCGSNYNCAGGMFCYQGYCRSPQCPASVNCVCSQPTNSPTPTTVYVSGPTNTPRPTPTPTLVVLKEAGSVDTTMAAIIGGLLLLGVGSFIWIGL